MCRAEALRHHTAHEVVGALVEKPTNLHIEEGQIDVLPLAGSVLMSERRKDGYGSVEPGHDVVDCDRNFDRRAIGLARHADESPMPWTTRS